ncbi:MAG TPA: hypothetical protein EYQ58_00495 [Candidatus Poseidoniales archaeon]|jgi:hypothetical protein|nr:hypothetical protein [Candidatus Poseidoniales archaeon]
MERIEGQAGRANIPARLTLLLSGFMLILLLALPFALDSDVEAEAFVYILYSLFLTCIGILIGIALTWIHVNPVTFSNLSNSEIQSIQSTFQSKQNSTRNLLTEGEKYVINYLLDRDGTCWQAQLVKDSKMTNSTMSRLLKKMESSQKIHRIREGMGKKVVLAEGFE